MKTILYISYDGMTDPLGQSQVIPYLAGLSKQGYEFLLLSFEKRDRYQQSGEMIRKLLAEHEIKWFPETFTKTPPILSKLYDKMVMKKALARLVKRYKVDLVHCRSYVAVEAGLDNKQKNNIPVLFDMRGFWVDERVDNGQWKMDNFFFRKLYTVYKKKEQSFLEKSDHIISLTYAGKDELVSRYKMPEGKISVIPCCVDTEHFDYTRIAGHDKISKRTELGLQPNDKVLTYLGSTNGWYLTDEMLDFFSLLLGKELATKFLFITYDDADTIKQRAIGKGIPAENILTHPASRKEVPLFLSISNWSIFFIKDAYSKKASSPTKQGEIMAMGIPVICNPIGDTGRIINESGTGIVVSNFSSECLLQALGSFEKLSAIEPEKIRKAAIRYFDLKNGIERYRQAYKSILGE